MKKLVSGIIPPIITTFDKDGNFDEKAQREVINFLIPHIGGLYPTGTYGSGPLMSNDERKKVAEVIVDEVNGRVPVILHVGTANTRDAIELAKHAEAIGASAVASIPPWYYKYPEGDIMNYFRAIMKAVKIPVLAYNNPGAAGNALTVAMVKTLAEEGLAGLKDSAFDLVTFMKFLTGVDTPGFLHIPGTEAIAAPAIQAGADAVVSGLANGWPEIMAELWQTLQHNDGREIGAAQLRVIMAREVMKSAPTLVVCYEVLRMRGVNAGYPRLPYSLLSDEKRASIRKAFGDMGMKFA